MERRHRSATRVTSLSQGSSPVAIKRSARARVAYDSEPNVPRTGQAALWAESAIPGLARHVDSPTELPVHVLARRVSPRPASAGADVAHPAFRVAFPVPLSEGCDRNPWD